MRTFPMIFSAPMVLALLAGRKTQTRRFAFKGQPGDLVWVKEAWRTMISLDALTPSELWSPEMERGAGIHYEAGGSAYISRGVSDDRPLVVGSLDQDDGPMPAYAGRLRAAMHLPMIFSRLTLRVSAVRSEPLQAITDSDALAEGVVVDEHGLCIVPGAGIADLSPKATYLALWDRINGDSDENPTVMVVTFEALRQNVKAVMGEANGRD